MKKIYFVFFILISIPFYAQVKEESINQEILNPALKLEQLDVTEITSGNLINRSLVFSNHTRFYKDASDFSEAFCSSCLSALG